MASLGTHERPPLSVRRSMVATKPNYTIATTMEMPPTRTSAGGRPNATSESIPSGISIPVNVSHEIAFAENVPIGSRSTGSLRLY